MRRRRMNKIGMIMLIAIMLAACSETGKVEYPEVTSVTTNTEVPRDSNGLYLLGKEPLHLTFYGHYSYYEMPKWGADPSSRWIRDQLNIHITQIGHEGNADHKLQQMIASGDLPDLIWGERDSDLERMREAGMLVPLNTYIEKYPNLKQWASPKVLKMLQAEDGNIYYFPNYYTDKPYGNAGYVVNREIYSKLGSPKLETTDDLYSYLKEVKRRYPDVIPFETGIASEGHGIDQLFSAFKENNFSFTRYYAVVNGDKMTSIYKDEGFRESALYVAKLMREGLMTTNAMLQTEDQVLEKLRNGEVAVHASADPLRLASIANAELSRNNPDAGYICIPPIYKDGLDPEKIYPGTYNVLGWNVTAITTAAENPEALFAMLDWMTGPFGSAVQFWGPPGPTGFWDGFQEDGFTPNFTSRYGNDTEELTRIQSLSGKMIWVGNTKFLDETKLAYEETLPPNQRNWTTYWQKEVTWQSQGDATPFINLFPMPNSTEGVILERVKDIWLDARAYALYAQSDEEVLAILDDAHESSMDIGFQLYLDYITEKWHSNLEALETVEPQGAR
ncbi:extracellular solute-binding protein [Paenibacillus sp. J5C_2022]|uniref:extracellular solute-binding protein n=1 Tax=Paenibacillus sp. J5C2022 TaxID=2977129 RepID=UPI0021D0FE0F|nr:extracellular solute-binding protein [Paenibacillus sp. J5C2022]MCU6710442.1 extracellular solute-binding protein [Paenibacillus sp. J5C2022]